MKTFPYGAVLKVQREYSWADIAERLDRIKQLGLNTVVIWPAVYWWEDRSLPNYPYNTGHRILEYAAAIGLNIVMELAGQITTLEYLPDFVMKDEYFAVNFDGSLYKDKLSYGYVNYFHPEVRQLIAKQFGEIAANYRGYSSLYGYDIWNETMFSSYDQYTLGRFRLWLQQKYQTIERLNASWERVYHDWSQIQYTRWLWASVMPKVDFHQFHKETVGMILKEWSDVVKAVDPVHPVLADNVHSMITQDGSYERPQDEWNVAANVDVMGMSFYPKNTPKVMSDVQRWETLTGFHSAATNGEFWVAELQTHLQTLFNPQSVVHPYELKWWNWEAVSHGAKGLMYWMWEPFIKGVQTMGRGLVDTRGRYTPRAEAAAEMARLIRENQAEFTTYQPEQPRAAILYDKTSHDFSKAYTEYYKPFIPDSIYLDSIAGLYQALWEQNIAAKFITPEAVLDGSAGQYPVLFISNQINLDDELAGGIADYVSRGGVVIADGKLGEVSDLGILHRDLPGGKLNEVLGYQHADFSPDDLDIELVWNGEPALTVPGYYDRRMLELSGTKPVEVLGRFGDGAPAVLRSRHGAGQIIYLATSLWYGYFREHHPSVARLMSLLAREFQLPLHTITNNELKICTLGGADGLLLFVFNYGQAEIGAEVELNLPGAGANPIQIAGLYSGTKQSCVAVQGVLKLPVTVQGRAVEIFKITVVS
jgi:beta-galactosidase